MMIERNAPCPCGSGKKYKKCCCAKDESAAATQRADQQRQLAEAAAAAAEAQRQQEREWEATSQLHATDAKEAAAFRAQNPFDGYVGSSAMVAKELGLPPLTAAEEQVVDAWWEAVVPVYLGKGDADQTAWLLERTLAFMDERPHLFEYLGLHDEFLLALGDALELAGRRDDKIALLRRLQTAQPRTYQQCFGYWDRDLLAEALRTRRREDIAACLTRFRQHPTRFVEELFEVVDLLAWHGCEAELRGLLEPTAAELADSRQVIDGSFGLRWLTNLALGSFLEAGDESPEAWEGLFQQIMPLGYLMDDEPNREWLRRAALMALPTATAAELDLKQPHGGGFDCDVAWAFVGWVHRTRGVSWLSARFLGHALLNYWYRPGSSKKSGKKGGQRHVAADFRLKPDALRNYLEKCRHGIFGIDALQVVSTLQAFHYFTEYLVARGHLDEVAAGRLQAVAAGSFETFRGLVGRDAPAFLIHPTYEGLIAGQWFDLPL